MEIIEISKRHTVFKDALEGWDLFLHLIKAEKHTYLIDTGIGKESMDAVLTYLEHKTDNLRIINSHYHWDHIMGNDCFQDKMIVSHTVCRDKIQQTWDASRASAKAYSKYEAKQVLPNVVFDHELHFPEDGIRLFHTPGHSEDGISIYDEIEGVLNMGDNLGDSLEYIMPALVTSQEIYKTSLIKCAALNPKVCISGHCGIQKPEIIDRVLSMINNK